LPANGRYIRWKSVGCTNAIAGKRAPTRLRSFTRSSPACRRWRFWGGRRRQAGLLRVGVQPNILILILILIFIRDGPDTAERDVKAPGRAQASWRGMSGRKPRKPCEPGTAHHGVPPERRRSRGKSDEGGPQPGANGLPTFPKESRSPVRGETHNPNHRGNGYTPDLKVPQDAERQTLRYHAERGNDQGKRRSALLRRIPTPDLYRCVSPPSPNTFRCFTPRATTHPGYAGGVKYIPSRPHTAPPGKPITTLRIHT
jgi:hypothetical protein